MQTNFEILKGLRGIIYCDHDLITHTQMWGEPKNGHDFAIESKKKWERFRHPVPNSGYDFATQLQIVGTISPHVRTISPPRLTSQSIVALKLHCSDSEKKNGTDENYSISLNNLKISCF